MRRSQCQIILDYLRRNRAVTYLQLMRAGAGSWPHKRITELEAKGYKFRRQWSLGNRRYRLISLVGSPK